MFQINYQLCKEFPAFTPFYIDDSSFYKVIELYADVRKSQIDIKKRSDPNRVIRKPAGDDWF